MKIDWIHHKTVNFEKVSEMIEFCQNKGYFTNGGKYVGQLESWIRQNLKIDSDKSVIACCNGTAAIHATVSALNMYYNKELKWATQSFTFPASAQGVLHDAKIVDIDEDGGLHLDQIDSSSVDGVIVTNVFGNLVDIDKYVKWSEKHGKLLLFDNAATCFSFYQGKNSCNYGFAATISFHHTKPLGFGEGGAIIIDQKYEESVRRVLNFGIDNIKLLPWDKWGSNYKMSEIAAIYILQYLENFQNIVDHHQKLYQIVQKSIEDSTDVEFFPNFSDQKPFLSCFCLVSSRFTPDFVKWVQGQGIVCRKYYCPLAKTKNSNNIYNKIICIPCHLDLTEQSLNHILSLVKDKSE